MKQFQQAIRVEKVSKLYGEKPVLCDFSLELPESGVVSFVGPSGCGKTTLLRLIAGVEAADGGVVIRSPSLKIAMLFQENRLIPGITALENIKVVLPKDKEALAQTCLRACGLEGAKNLFPNELSGGMARRLAIARAMAFEGDVLFLDEPFVGMDAESLKVTVEFMFNSSKAGVAQPRLKLVVTHDIDIALSVSDYIFAFEGTPLKLRTKVTLPKDMALTERKELAVQRLPQSLLSMEHEVQ